MTTLAQDLGGVVRLLEKATPGPWSYCGQSTGHACTCGLIWGAGDHSPAVAEFSLTDEEYEGHRPAQGEREANTELAVAAVNFLRAHSAEIAGALRDAEGWQPIETAPRDGSRILAMIRWSWSDGTDGEAQDVIYWCAGGKFWVCGTPMNYVQGLDEGVEPTHWRPLPAPPTQDSAMQQGGGGE